MNLRPRLFRAGLLLGCSGIALFAQRPPIPESGPKIPSFLQGLSPKILAGKPIQRFLTSWTLRSPDGEAIPEARGARLAAQIQQLGGVSPSRGGSAPTSALTLSLNNMRWTNVGPQPVQNGQVGDTITNRLMSGRIAAIAVHPNDPNRWLIGAANGGVWETRDAGGSFRPLTDAAPSQAIGAIAYAPSDPSIIYAGTGEATFAGDSFGGEGILKSTDGGLTWTQLGVSTFIKGTAFSEIRVDPSNPDRLVAATSLGLFGRVGAAARPQGFGARGFWISNDGGQNWIQTLAIDGISIAVHPAAFSQMYGGEGFGSNVGNAVLRSMNGGISWSVAPGPWNVLAGNTDRTVIAIAPSNPNRIYVAVSSSSTGGLFGLWTTANGWDPTPNWIKIDVSPTDDGSGSFGPCGYDKAFSTVASQCWYNLTLTVKPTDQTKLFFGGVTLYRYDMVSDSWAEVSQTAAPADRNNGIHVDQHAAVWSGGRLIVGNDGGVWSTTTDGNGKWFEHNSSLSISQYYEGSISPDGSQVLAGAQDNGTHRRNGTQSWPLIFGGDGAGNIFGSAFDFAVSSQGHNIARTTDGGQTFVGVKGNYGGASPFIGKMRECPSSPGTVILNGSRINKTTNFYTGPENSLWTNNGGGIFNGSVGGVGIAFGNNCNTFAMGSIDGQILLSTNGGVNRSDLHDVNPNGQVPPRPVATIAFPSKNNTKMCAGLTGFSGGLPANIYCTYDFTQPQPSWTNVSVPVDVSVVSLAIDPDNNNIMYAGTDFAIWYTNDSGSTWAFMGPTMGMPNTAVYDIVARAGRVFAFTHGRGAFMLVNFDLNNDGVVDCTDVNIVRGAFGKRVGEQGYIANADLNGDNVVNLRDLSMLTQMLSARTYCQ